MNQEYGRDLSSDLDLSSHSITQPKTLAGASGLVVERIPALLELQTRDCFIGIGVASKGLPLDVMALLLAASEMRSLTVVLVDEFAKINGLSAGEIEHNIRNLQRLIDATNYCYDLKIKVLRSECVMATQNYCKILESVRAQCLTPELQPLLLQTIPNSRRSEDLDFSYTCNEIALSQVMSQGLGYTVKFGPSREKVYDQIMQALQMPIEFCYVVDAMPIGVSRPRSVVHYVSTHLGSVGAERILLESGFDVILEQLGRASMRSAAYLNTIANCAAKLRGYETSKFHDSPQQLLEAMQHNVMRHVVLPVKDAL